jgi:hypothetical protein
VTRAAALTAHAHARTAAGCAPGGREAAGAVRLARRALRALPPTLPPSAHALDASGNALVALPRELGALRNLRSLDLSGNGLRVLPVRRARACSAPARMPGAVAARSLTLARAPPPPHIPLLQAAIGELVLLEQLNLQHNALTTVPPEIGAPSLPMCAARFFVSPLMPPPPNTPQAGCGGCTRWGCAATR